MLKHISHFPLFTLILLSCLVNVVAPLALAQVTNSGNAIYIREQVGNQEIIDYATGQVTALSQNDCGRLSTHLEYLANYRLENPEQLTFTHLGTGAIIAQVPWRSEWGANRSNNPAFCTVVNEWVDNTTFRLPSVQGNNQYYDVNISTGVVTGPITVVSTGADLPLMDPGVSELGLGVDATLSPSGDQAIYSQCEDAGCNQTRYVIFDVRQQEVVTELTSPGLNFYYARRVPGAFVFSWSHDERYIAISSETEVLAVYDNQSNDWVDLTFLPPSFRDITRTTRGWNWSPNDTQLAFSVDGLTAMGYSFDVGIMTIDLAARTYQAFEIDDDNIRSLVWEPSAERLLITFSDGDLYRLDFSDASLQFVNDHVSGVVAWYSPVTTLPTPTATSLPPPALTALCTLDPATTRNWRITNPNAAELAVTWQLFNSPTQMGTVTIPANGTYDFSTTVEAGNETMRLIVGGQVVAEATGSAEPCGGGVVTPTPTSTPSPEATPTPTVTESLTETPTATGTLEATATPTETPTSTPSPEATLTPTATATGTPPPTGSTFYRAVNLGGPALTIGGNAWEANETTTVDFSTNGFVLCNPWLTFNPAASGAQAEMLSCWREHWAHDMAMSNMPVGTYEVYIYALQSWNNIEGNIPYGIQLEGLAVDSYAPGTADGVWSRRGPFVVQVTDGALNVTTTDTIAVLTGLEVYRLNTATPTPSPATATPTPTDPPPTPTGTPEPTPTPTVTPTGTPPAETFYRAVNLGGPALTIDGRNWEANETTTPNFFSNGYQLCNPWLTFNPPTSGAQAEMLSCWREHWAHSMSMSAMPSGTYRVYVYVVQSWNDPAGVDPFTLRLEGAVVDSYAPGVVDGVWVRRGPFTVSVTDGALNLTTQDGNPVLTGLEVYSINP